MERAAVEGKGTEGEEKEGEEEREGNGNWGVALYALGGYTPLLERRSRSRTSSHVYTPI